MMRTFAHRPTHARTTSGPGQILAGPGLRRATGQRAEIRQILGRGAVQPKLQVSEPGDALEQEADRMAEEVMRLDVSDRATAMRTHASPPAVQRGCDGGGRSLQHAAGERVQRDALEEEEVLQPKRNVAQPVEATPVPVLERPMLKSGCACGGGCSSCRAAPVVPVDDRLEHEADQVADRVMREAALARGPPATSVNASASEMQSVRNRREERAGEQVPNGLPWLGAAHAGEPLSPELRAFYEPRFGRDFSGVRLHHGPAAGTSARALGARAYAFGRDIAFAPGEFRPRSIAGRRLIAHELAHVAQQGRAPPIGRQGRGGAGVQGPGLARVSRRIQRACGPGEIGSPPDCERTTGDIFGTPFRFRVDCDLFAAPSEEEGLRDAAQLIGGGRANVHGFASTEGGDEYNYNLSCSRAHVAAAILRSHGVDVVKLLAHGATPGPAADRRSVVLEPLVTPTPEPAPEPVPTPEPPTPEPEPEPTEDNGCEWFSCSTPYNMVPSPLNVLIPNAIDCLCEGVKFVDIIEDFLVLIPPLAPFFGNPVVQEVISIADVFCGVWDLLELVFYTGCSPGPCWSPSHIDLIEAGRILAYAVSLPVDYYSDSIFGGIVTRLVELLATIVEAIITGGGFASSGPVGAFVALLGSETLKQAIAAAVRMLVEFMIDLTTYLTQNQITHGTPFPLDSCRACAGLASQVGISDYSSYCDTLAALVTPDPLHWESFDPQNPGGGGG